MSEVRQPVGLFVNQPQANCSIYESGMMVFHCLQQSDRLRLDYMTLSRENPVVPAGYDFYLFNYHYLTMDWLDTASIQKLPGLKMTLILETWPNDPFCLTPNDAFDVYCAMDPTIQTDDPRVYAFPRPLEVYTPKPYVDRGVPVIGTFGFATPGKGFELVTDAVNREFDEAIIRLNISPSTFADEVMWYLYKQRYADYLGNLCQKIAKKGITLEVTQDYMTKEELIEWCGQNTLNCFLYKRFQPGLAATTDQAVTSGRPIAVSAYDTFRHIHQYVKPYPMQSLRESIAFTEEAVHQMQQDWSTQKFAKRFEKILANHALVSGSGPQDIHLSSNEMIYLSYRPEWLQPIYAPMVPQTGAAQVRPKITLKAFLRKPRQVFLQLSWADHARMVWVRTRDFVKHLFQLGRGLAKQPRKALRDMLLTSPEKQRLNSGAVLIRQIQRVPALPPVDTETVKPVKKEEPLSARVIQTNTAPDKTVLFVNHTQQECGIYQYGGNTIEALQKSKRYRFAYADCDTPESLEQAVQQENPDAILYNYYPFSMPWLNPQITRQYAIPQVHILHECTQEAADQATQELFDYHLCPDPTLIENNPSVFKLRRLIPPYLNTAQVPEIPRIGSFGFGFWDKGFERLIDQVQAEFDEAAIQIHMPIHPLTQHVELLNSHATAKRCRERIYKPKVKLTIHHRFLSKSELLQFLSQNSINVFLYNEDKNLGISSVVEYALAVHRPIAVSRAPMFRHVLQAEPSICIEDASLKEIMAHDIVPLVGFYNEWSEAAFMMDYERIFDTIFSNSKQSTDLDLGARTEVISHANH